MADKIWVEGHWFFALDMRGYVYSKAGFYGVGEARNYKDCIVISCQEARQLISVMEQEGEIKPRLDERLRAEDLKITHRLLDIIQKQLEGGK